MKKICLLVLITLSFLASCEDGGSTACPKATPEETLATVQHSMYSLESIAINFAAIQLDDPYPFNKIPVGSYLRKWTHWISSNHDLMTLFGKQSNSSIKSYRALIGYLALDNISGELCGSTNMKVAQLLKEADAKLPNEYDDWETFAKKISNLIQDLEAKRSSVTKEKYDRPAAQKSADEFLQKHMPPEEFIKFRNGLVHRGLMDVDHIH